MRCGLILILLLITFSESYAQKLIARTVKNSHYKDGEELMLNKPVKAGSEIEIERDGELWLKYGRRYFWLFSGVYSIDSVLVAQTKSNLKMDSMYKVVKSKKLLRCQEERALQCFGTDSSSRGKIEKLEIDSTIPLELKWSLGDFTGKYYVMVRNLFDEYVYLESTTANSVKIELDKFRPDKTFICKVVTESCRASNTLLISVK